MSAGACALFERLLRAMPLLHCNPLQSVAEHFRAVSTPRLCPRHSRRPSFFTSTFTADASRGSCNSETLPSENLHGGCRTCFTASKGDRARPKGSWPKWASCVPWMWPEFMYWWFGQMYSHTCWCVPLFLGGVSADCLCSTCLGMLKIMGCFGVVGAPKDHCGKTLAASGPPRLVVAQIDTEMPNDSTIRPSRDGKKEQQWWRKTENNTTWTHPSTTTFSGLGAPTIQASTLRAEKPRHGHHPSGSHPPSNDFLGSSPQPFGSSTLQTSKLRASLPRAQPKLAETRAGSACPNSVRMNEHIRPVSVGTHSVSWCQIWPCASTAAERGPLALGSRWPPSPTSLRLGSLWASRTPASFDVDKSHLGQSNILCVCACCLWER